MYRVDVFKLLHHIYFFPKFSKQFLLKIVDIFHTFNEWRLTMGKIETQEMKKNIAKLLS